MITINTIADIREIGGKAHTLLHLNIPNTPMLRVIPASFFRKRRTDGTLDDALKAELDKALDGRKCYAVRSSAIDEDSHTASFAGIHESYLNVRKEAVFEYILKVYDSAFSERALEYRRLQSLGTEQIDIAVIVQDMIDPDIAGVAFTINPVADNPDEIVLSVTKGLGDKLVDGSVAGSTYTINGSEVTCRGEDILSRKQTDAVLAMIREVVHKTDAFMDIEFAVTGNIVHFLQARPIVAYNGIHPSKRSLLIDNANIIESYFGVTSPLTYTFAKDVYRDVYTATLRCGKVRQAILDELAPSLENMLYMHEGKIYYNMNSWYHVTSIFPSKKATSHMEGMMGTKSSTKQFQRLRLNLWDMAKLAVLFVSKLITIDSLSDRFEKRFDDIVMPYYGHPINGTNDELHKLFRTIEGKIVKEFVVPIINDCAVMIYFGRLKDKAARHRISKDELNRYISNHGSVKSVGSATELAAIVQRIRADERLYRDFKTLSEEELAEKYRQGTAISEDLQRYRLTFGARVGDELKLETVTMIEDERLLYRIIAQNLDIPAVSAEYQQVEVPRALRSLGEKTKKYIKNRERLRLKRTYMYSVVRNIFLAYGRNYCKEGRLDKAEDVFYLTKDEVFRGEGDFKQLVAARKLTEEQYRKAPTHDRVVFFGDRMLAVKHETEDGDIRGIPTGAGVVTARVRLMNSPQDELSPGDIILTKRTDPGWISLFPRAAGLIVEHGSMLSHSFVVAREMNLPAVVGIDDATVRIPNGAVVTLDGINGVVTIEQDSGIL